MGLLSFILGKKNLTVKNQTSLSDLLIAYINSSDDPLKSSLYMSVVDAHARHVSKVQAEAYLNDKPAESKKYITRLLTLRPNPLMNAPTFWETVARYYWTSNNAFIWLEWDYENYKQPLKALWVLDSDLNSMRVKANETTGAIYIEFILDGKKHISHIDDMVVISRNVDPSRFFGKSNEAIKQVLKVLNTNYSGMEQAVRTSAFIRFIVKSATMISDDIKKQKSEYFAKTYLGQDSSGVVYIDQAQEIQQVTNNVKTVDADLLAITKKDVYEYLGSNEKITTATFNEDEWQAYYESAIEPLLLKIGAELTYKIYTAEEIAKGNRIRIISDKLQTASMKTRVNIASIIQKQPVYVPNVVNKLLYLPETENGDKEYSSLNYVLTDNQNKVDLNDESDADSINGNKED